MTVRIYHRVRLPPSLEQQQQLKRWRQPLADLQLCADLLLTAILDGRTPERLDDLAALLAAALSATFRTRCPPFASTTSSATTPWPWAAPPCA